QAAQQRSIGEKVPAQLAGPAETRANTVDR
ncbi:MAG: hypothetical protein HW411_1229, partial [Gammaproteobacteria bacterium]|nr:hypothetical protein [Gammaproteobacteria bacterium]